MIEQLDEDSGSLECRTEIAGSKPATEDRFESGAHTRAATAIAEAINSIPGGTAIGLEGAWGSGKSTLINLITNDLRREPGTEVFLFDAWSHEGDPLRRSFLERLIQRMRALRWIENEEAWDQEFQSLSGTRAVTNTTPKIALTGAGYVGVLLALLVPVGSSIIGTVVVTAGQGAYTAFETVWMLLLGSLTVAAPLIAYRLKGNPALLRVETILTNQTTTTTRTQPTSVEFEDVFRRLIVECVGPTSGRKLVIIVDNLDRLAPEQSLTIWSTLQTFLGQTVTEDWLQRVCVLLPYDREAIGGLWSDRPGASEETTEGFVQKSVQLRFQVPPPALADWRAYLRDQQLAHVLPSHSREDLDKIVRVCSLMGPWSQTSPTPRELEVFANAIGSLHRRWSKDADLHDVELLTLYEVGCRTAGGTPQRLLSALTADDSPIRRYAMLLGRAEEDVVLQLAAVALGSSVEKARHIVFDEPINSALRRNEPQSLVSLASASGFWDAMDRVPLIGLSPLEAVNAAACMYSFSQSSDHAVLHQQRTILEQVIASAPPTDLPIGDPDTLANAMRFVRAPRALEAVLAGIHANVLTGGDGASRAVRLIAPVRTALDELGEAEDTGRSVQLSVDTASIVAGGAELASVVAEPSRTPVVLSGFDVGELTTIVSTAVEEGRLNDVLPILRMGKSLEGVPWKEMVTGIETRARDAGVRAVEAERILDALHVLAPVPVPAATEALTQLALDGFALHYMKICEPRPTGWARWTYLYLDSFPDGEGADRPGQAPEAYEFLTETLNVSPGDHQDLVDALAGYLRETTPALVVRVWDSGRLLVFAASVATAMLKQGWRPAGDDVVEHPALYSMLIETDGSLAPLIVGDGTRLKELLTSKAFNEGFATLYEQIDWDSGLAEWASGEIGRTAARDLTDDLLEGRARARWAVQLTDDDRPWPLTHPMRGALEDYVVAVGRGGDTDTTVDQFAKLFGHLDSGAQDGVFRAFVRELHAPRAGFFESVGELGILVFGARLMRDREALDELDRHIRARNDEAVAWVAELMERTKASHLDGDLAAVRATVVTELLASKGEVSEGLERLAVALDVPIPLTDADPISPDLADDSLEAK